MREKKSVVGAGIYGAVNQNKGALGEGKPFSIISTIPIENPDNFKH